jgi:hypothetical protein
MRCADLLNHDDEHYFMLLRNDLPKFIIYLSILQMVRKSLAAFDEDFLQQSSKVQSPTLWKVWNAYT